MNRNIKKDKIKTMITINQTINTGITEIDNITGAIPQGSVTMLSSPPFKFKTHTGLTTAYNNLIDGKNILYVHLEQTRDYMYKNLLLRHSKEMGIELTYVNINNNNSICYELDMTTDNYEQVYSDFNDKYLNQITFANINYFNKVGITHIVNNIQNILKQTDNKLNIVIIDFLQLVKFSVDINLFVDEFSQICKDQNIVGIILSEMNRLDCSYIQQDKFKKIEADNIHKVCNVLAFNAPTSMIDEGQIYMYPVKVNGTIQKSIIPVILNYG